MNATLITDHQDQAVARLAHQFKEKTLIEGFVRSLTQEWQDLEQIFFDLVDDRLVSTAIGAQLDGIGSIVGEKRRGREDLAYRQAIIARIAINNSKGTPNEAITIFSLLTGATIVHLLEYFPGVVEIYGNTNFEYTYENLGEDSFAFDGGIDGLGFGDVFDPEVGGIFVGLVLYDVTALYYVMDHVIPAGVRLEALGYFEDEPFGFEGDANAFGFGDVFDVTVGGKFAKVVLQG